MPGGHLIGEGTYAQPDVSWWLNPCAEPEVSAMPYCDESLDSWERALDLSGRLNVTNYLHYWNSTQRGPLAYDGIRIPPMGMVEGIHGAVCGGVVPPSTTTTNFPIGVGMGSSFDRDLVREIGLAVGTETRIKTNHFLKQGIYGGEVGLVAVAPQLNLARDPRWGRTAETFSECPFQVGELGAAYVAGLRGDLYRRHYLIIPAPKHFDVHGGPEDYNATVTRMNFNAVLSARDWIATFQPQWRAAAKAGSQGCMCSYNAVNGMPTCANRELLTDLLQSWGIEHPITTSDCGSVSQIYSEHHYAQSLTEAAVMAINAGVDTLCDTAPLEEVRPCAIVPTSLPSLAFPSIESEAV
jgi:beta-glucosidase